MNLKFAQNFLESIYPIPGVDASSQCGRVYVLNAQERALSELLYFMRQLNLGKEGAIKLRFHPGPFGRIGQRGWWWPLPNEGCDFDLEHWDGLGKPDAWALWKHCRTIQHVEYLVKNRPGSLIGNILGGFDLLPIRFLLENIEKNEVEISAAQRGKHWLVDRYFDDLATGKYKKPPGYFVKNTRFDILKK